MQKTVKELAEQRGIDKTYILRLLRNNKAHLLLNMGVKSWYMLGNQYVLTMVKDFEKKVS